MAIARALPNRHANRPARRAGAFTVLWTTCIVVGLILFATFAYGMWSGYRDQQRLNSEWQAAAGSASSTPAVITGPAPIDPSLKRPLKGLDFAIRIPRLNYYAAVKEGVDSGVLYAGPGHYPTTMWPGDAGTVGVAAHNVYWINFPQLTNGDEVDIETRYGLYRYRVTGSEIVDPTNRSVLVPNADGFHLTLTTCWPLWAGAFATRRYVIFTEQFWPIPVRRAYT